MHYWEVQASLAGDRFIEVQAREAILLGAVTLLALGASVILVARSFEATRVLGWFGREKGRAAPVRAKRR